MCDKCFNIEIKSFPTLKIYEEFDLVLTKKMANEKSIRSKDYAVWKDVGYQVYECLACGQLWKHSTPDSYNGGYFLRLTE
jgi:hypothetical protein